MKNGEVLPFATIWIDLDGIKLNKSDRGRKTLDFFNYMCNLKNKKKIFLSK